MALDLAPGTRRLHLSPGDQSGKNWRRERDSKFRPPVKSASYGFRRKSCPHRSPEIPIAVTGSVTGNPVHLGTPCPAFALFVPHASLNPPSLSDRHGSLPSGVEFDVNRRLYSDGPSPRRLRKWCRSVLAVPNPLREATWSALSIVCSSSSFARSILW